MREIQAALDETIAETERQLEQLVECMAELRHHLAELRRARRALDDAVSTGTADA